MKTKALGVASVALGSVAELSHFWFAFLCIASSLLGIIVFPTLVVLGFDIIGINTEAPLSNVVGWLLVSAALLGLVFPLIVLMIARAGAMSETKGGELMTDTNLNSGKAAPPPSLNDSLPSGNPSLQVVLAALGCIALGALVLVFRSSLGF
jgi:hypothetical protein